jgi:hypothetical protein
MLSAVVPDSDGMMTTDCGPRFREPIRMNSAGHDAKAGKADCACSSAAAGCMRMPAPPLPRKNRFCVPSARHFSIVAPRSPARSTAPA